MGGIPKSSIVYFGINHKSSSYWGITIYGNSQEGFNKIDPQWMFFYSESSIVHHLQDPENSEVNYIQSLQVELILFFG